MKGQLSAAGAAIACGADMAIGLWAGTQWMAWRLHHHAVLGQPWSAPSAPVTWCGIVVAATFAVAAVVALCTPGWRRLVPMALIGAGLAAIVALGQPIYAPWAILVWRWRFRHAARLIIVAQHAWLVFAGTTIGATVATLLVLTWPRRRVPVSGSYGTAAWNAGDTLNGERGLVLGWGDQVTRARGAGGS